MRSQEDLKAIIENLEDCDFEIYATRRARRERLWVAGYVAVGFGLLALTIVLPFWYLRLLCVIGYLAVSYGFDRFTKLT